jgi:N-acetylneuraminic acid mutarotase
VDLHGETIETYISPTDGDVGMAREFPMVETDAIRFLLAGNGNAKLIMNNTTMKKPTATLLWHERADMPLPRGGYIAGVVDQKFLIAGGSFWENGKKQWSGRTDLFDPTANAWERSTPLPAPRSDAGVVNVGNALYVFGGGADGDICNDAWVFQDRKWTALPGAKLPEARLQPVAVAHAGLIYLMGGLSTPGVYTTATSNFWVWNPQTPEAGWKMLPELPGPGRFAHAMVTVDEKIYVLGGCTGHESGDVRNLYDVYFYDPKSSEWRQLAILPVARRAWWAVAFEGKILVLGGYTDAFEDQVFLYDPASGDFQEIGRMPHGLADAKFFWIGNSLLTAGGESGNRTRGLWTLQAQVASALQVTGIAPVEGHATEN